MFDTPVLFIIFNRPETTSLVFEQIKKVQPKYLFVAADGPRSHMPGELEICNAAREVVLNGIDWDCEIKTLFRTENTGCKKAVSKAINWFFENVEQGIILEDDCLPDQKFFTFCKEMLWEYKGDMDIIAINGCNFNYHKNDDEGYFFSRYMNVWGWATWKRAAEMIDYNMPSWNNEHKLYFLWKKLRNNLLDFDLDWYSYWRNNFDEIVEKKLDTWDYQWQYYQFLTGKKTIVAARNLVVNIGFDESATHTTMLNHPAAELRIEQIILPVKMLSHKRICKDYEETMIRPIWHLYKRKDNLFYILNYINTRPLVQFFRTTLKLNK